MHVFQGRIRNFPEGALTPMGGGRRPIIRPFFQKMYENEENLRWARGHVQNITM